MPNFTMRQVNPAATKPDPVPILGGYLRQGCITSLTGARSSFKSTAAISMALAVANGTHFGQAGSGSKRTVVYMTLADRHARERLVDMSDPSDDYNIFTVTPVPFNKAAKNTENKDFEVLDWVKPTRAFVDELRSINNSSAPVGLLVIDGLAATAGNLKLAFDNDAAEYMSNLRSLLPIVGSILIVNNEAPYGGVPGSVVLTDNIDVDLRVMRFKNNRQRVIDPLKDEAILSCFASRFRDHPQSLQLLWSEQRQELHTQPIRLSDDEASVFGVDFLTDTQRADLDAVLRKTAKMSPEDIRGIKQFFRADPDTDGNLRKLNGNLLKRINASIGRHLSIRQTDDISQPAFLKEALINERDRLVFDPRKADPTYAEEFEEAAKSLDDPIGKLKDDQWQLQNGDDF